MGCVLPGAGKKRQPQATCRRPFGPGRTELLRHSLRSLLRSAPSPPVQKAGPGPEDRPPVTGSDSATASPEAHGGVVAARFDALAAAGGVLVARLAGVGGGGASRDSGEVAALQGAERFA